MKNSEIVELVEQIVSPYFQFNMADFYGDRGSYTYPDVNEISVLFFRKDGGRSGSRVPYISKQHENILIEKIKDLHLEGIEIEIDTVNYYGRYIIIKRLND